MSVLAVGGCGLISPPEKDPQSVDGAKPIYAPSLTPSIQVTNAGQPVTIDESDISSTTNLEGARYRRNSTVGFYLQQSDINCTEYLQNLTKTQREYGLIFGSLATIFGGAGAAFTQASVARPLSALAGISSAERAEVDADTFAKQTSQVIISGIKNSRVRAYNEIVQNKFGLSVTDWPMSLALADVQDYHRRCSLNEGVTEAAASINAVAPQSTDGGIKSANAGRNEGPPSLSATKGRTQADATVGAVAALQQLQASGTAVSTAAISAAAQGSLAGAGTTQLGQANSVPAAAAAGRAVVTPPAAPVTGSPGPAPAPVASKATTPSAMTLDDWLHPGGTLSVEHRNALLAWLRTQTVEPAMPKTPFSEILLNKPGYEAVRQAAVKDLVK